jgi:tetratricopeptide (TPR) repeat protein
MSALFALLFSTALAQDLTPEPTPMSEEQRTELFAAFDTATAAGRKAEAADALLEILSDEEKALGHGTAWVELAEVLQGYQLDTAALTAWKRALETEPVQVAPHLDDVLALAKEIEDEAFIAPLMSDNLGLDVSSETRSTMALLAGRHLLEIGELNKALGILLAADKSAPDYLEARSLYGIVLAQQGRYEDALGALLEAQQLSRRQGRSDRTRNVVDINVARVYYGAENWGQAIAAYAAVDRGSEYWPEAQFERAWAHFRADDLTGALGLLMNHDSPFFDDWYFPEGDLLRSYSLFLLCKFPDASREMDQFSDAYMPLKQELDTLVPQMDATAAFADASAFLRGEPTQLPSRILRPYSYEDRIASAVRMVDLTNEEITRTDSLSNNVIGAKAKEWTEARRDAVLAAEGQRVLDRTQASRQELKEMLEGIELTRLDLLNLEAQIYERAASLGKLEFGDRLGKLRSMRKNRKSSWVWPFQGEYWADELGWYQIDARPDCPEKLLTDENER